MAQQTRSMSISCLSALHNFTRASLYLVIQTAINYAVFGALTSSLPISGQRLPTQGLPESPLTSMVTFF